MDRVLSRVYFEDAKNSRQRKGEENRFQIATSFEKIVEKVEGFKGDIYFPNEPLSFLETLDVVGVTEKMNEFMVELSLIMEWPLQWFTYGMLKQ